MEKEIIKQIEEVESYVPERRDDWDMFFGYVVHTNKQKIELLISERQNYCEIFGYFWSNDDWDDFVGVEFYGIEVVDACLNKKKLVDVEEGEIMFVNLETSKGTLQFTAYNCHNGYHGHTAFVKSTQLEVERTL